MSIRISYTIFEQEMFFVGSEDNIQLHSLVIFSDIYCGFDMKNTFDVYVSSILDIKSFSDVPLKIIQSTIHSSSLRE